MKRRELLLKKYDEWEMGRQAAQLYSKTLVLFLDTVAACPNVLLVRLDIRIDYK